MDSKETITYSGLYNTGCTDYLNAILQCLFMTPEFRISLLTWVYDEKIHGIKEKCMMYQLQKLFSKMQLKQTDAQETVDLVKGNI